MNSSAWTSTYENVLMGHRSENTIEEIWYGEHYERLRDQHRTGDYPDFCKGCDFLLDDPEVLVYSNFGRDNYKMYGTEFDLDDYRDVTKTWSMDDSNTKQPAFDVLSRTRRGVLERVWSQIL